MQFGFVKMIFRIFFIIPAFCILGCMESSFRLAEDSRLPKWFEVPAEMDRGELGVSMDYYSYPSGTYAVFKLYNRYGIRLKKVTGKARGIHPIYLGPEDTDPLEQYPSYEVITVDGITDIIEHRKMGPIFYINDDPEVWEKLGVEN